MLLLGADLGLRFAELKDCMSLRERVLEFQYLRCRNRETALLPNVCAQKPYRLRPLH